MSELQQVVIVFRKVSRFSIEDRSEVSFGFAPCLDSESDAIASDGSDIEADYEPDFGDFGVQVPVDPPGRRTVVGSIF